MTIATQDKLFSYYHAQQGPTCKSTKQSKIVLHLATTLSCRLQRTLAFPAFTVIRATERSINILGLKCGGSLANLKHIILCLQQAAMEALYYQIAKLVKDDIAHWYRYWRQRRHSCEAWFTEWPNGRRPLSTRWPWNIRPSLVILWGVCWVRDDDSITCVVTDM